MALFLFGLGFEPESRQGDLTFVQYIFASYVNLEGDYWLTLGVFATIQIKHHVQDGRLVTVVAA